MKNAFITGICGQDGFYLYNHLTSLGFNVKGTDIFKCQWADEKKAIVNIELLNKNEVFEFLNKFCPDEIYHLAAYNYSSEVKIENDISVFNKSYENNVLTTLHLLDWIKNFSPKTKMFYAGTSHMFGNIKEYPQTEESKFEPNCPYGISKYLGMSAFRYYRNTYGIFASVGILYNHESPRRSPKFISQKIVKNAVDIKLGLKNTLVVGNLNSIVDWGYAGDYVEAMYKILQQKKPSDFIISSGEKKTVKDFIKIVFNILGINFKKHVTEDPSLLRPSKKGILIGDNSKLKNETTWYKVTSLEMLAKIMVNKEIERRSCDKNKNSDICSNI
ncbi:NAD-dependent epimerase/dehydratase family protein [bacterium]|jgi:GDPmannose 4,6-dehydratase|nr:NAD-dependent epimerase/dehydratase family protein [bacterium]